MVHMFKLQNELKSLNLPLECACCPLFSTHLHSERGSVDFTEEAKGLGRSRGVVVTQEARASGETHQRYLEERRGTETHAGG